VAGLEPGALTSRAFSALPGERQRESCLQGIAFNLEAWTVQVRARAPTATLSPMRSASCCLSVRLPDSPPRGGCGRVEMGGAAAGGGAGWG
jgi:hypothetical protein